MTSRGDDDSNEPSDPVLDSMRTVWLSMRDEEPPPAGLSQLLAAARAKAEAMQPKPAWWRRALLACKRPPVLALATTLVLLGGAVLVARRQDNVAPVTHDEVRSTDTPTASGSAAPMPPQSAPVPAPAGGESTVQPDEREQAPEVPKPEPPATPEPARRRPSPHVGAAPRPPVASPRREAPAPVAEQRAEVPPPPPPAPPAAPSPVTANERTDGRAPAAAPGRVMEDELPNKPATVERDFSSSKSRSGFGEGAELELKDSPVTDEEVQGTKPSRGTRGPTVEQLARQSVTAAAHGDCPAVRAITSRMRKLDQAAYRTHVANNATVKSCVTAR